MFDLGFRIVFSDARPSLLAATSENRHLADRDPAAAVVWGLSWRFARRYGRAGQT